MAESKIKTYTLMVFNTMTRLYEEVTVSEEIYRVYRRTEWNIRDNDQSYYDHEIQMSSLIGGEDGNYENFREFIDTDNTPEILVLAKMQIDALLQALDELPEVEKSLIQAIYFKGMTEREYASRTGLPQKTVNNRKLAILRKLRKLPAFKK